MTQVGLRDRKKAQTRERIEQAALELFDERGFDGTTIDDIAAAVDVAPRTVYRYFETKEDVALANYARRLDALLGALRGRPTDEPAWESLRQAFRSVVGTSQEQEEMLPRLRLMADAPSVFARSLQIQAGWEIQLAEVLEERLADLDDPVSPVLLSAAALSVMRAAIRYWTSTPSDVDLPTFVDGCFQRLADGLTKH